MMNFTSRRITRFRACSRDNYDKEVRSKNSEKGRKQAHQGARPKKPQMQVYVPPSRQEHAETKLLFCLEFEDRDGKVYKEEIFEDDKAHSKARKISAECQLPPRLMDALQLRIQQEIDKRLSINDT